MERYCEEFEGTFENQLKYFLDYLTFGANGNTHAGKRASGLTGLPHVD